MTGAPTPANADSQRGGVRLERALGPFVLAANVVNMTIGAGIFVIPAVIAGVLGQAAVSAYLVCGVAVALIYLCFAEVGSQTTVSGGAVAYIENAFGPLAGFLAWVTYSLGFVVASDAAIANVLADTVSVVFPAAASGPVRAMFMVALFGGLAAINVVGVRHGARLTVVTTLAKTTPLILLALAGFSSVKLSSYRPFEWPAISDLGAASLLLFFAYSGGENALTPSGEIRNPARSVPRGLFFGVGFLIVLYLALQMVSYGVLGDSLAETRDAPLAAVAGNLFGSTGAKLVLICTGMSVFGTLAGMMLATPRAFYFAAKSGMLPAKLADINRRFRTPHYSIVTYGSMSCLLSIAGGFEGLAMLSSVMLLVVYFGVCLAALKLRFETTRPAGSFRAPGGPLAPVLALLSVGWLLGHSSRVEVVAVAAMFAVSTAYYYVRRRTVS